MVADNMHPFRMNFFDGYLELLHISESCFGRTNCLAFSFRWLVISIWLRQILGWFISYSFHWVAMAGVKINRCEFGKPVDGSVIAWSCRFCSIMIGLYSARKRKPNVVVGADRKNSFCYRVDRVKFSRRYVLRMLQPLILIQRTAKTYGYETFLIGVDSQ